MKTQKSNKGTALVMALMLVPVLMLLAATFVDPIVRSYRAAVADQKSLLARNVAENLFEQAMFESQYAGVGETMSGEIKEEYDFGTATGKWTVYQTPDTEHLIEVAGKKYYTVPSAGSGDAGGDYCSTKEPVINEGRLTRKQVELGIDPKFLPLKNEPDVFEWPCHWNKLYEGESVTIPLYVESRGTVINPWFSLDDEGNINLGGGLGLSAFDMVVRPACDPRRTMTARGDDPYKNEICAPNERYVLGGDANTVIVLWEIVGEEVDDRGEPTGRQVYLGPYRKELTENSNIYSSDINSYQTRSLNHSSPTEDNFGEQWHTIIQHLHTDYPGDHQYINKPVLRLQVVHTLYTEDDRKVPYLEYQFRSPDEMPVASTSKVVKIDVTVEGGYSETIERTIHLPKPVTGFVIQQ